MSLEPSSDVGSVDLVVRGVRGFKHFCFIFNFPLEPTSDVRSVELAVHRV